MVKLRINKMFGKYTNELDLFKKCLILIGENGLGKSTILKIVDNLIKGDFLELCYSNFESIDIIDNNEAYTIYMSEIIPKVEEIIDEVLNGEFSNYNSREIFQEPLVQKYKYINEDIRKRLSDINLENPNAYNKLISDIYFKKPLDPWLENSLPNFEHLENGEFIFTYEMIEKAVSSSFKMSARSYHTGEISYLIRSSCEIEDSIYIDFVEKYSVSDETSKSVVYSEAITSLSSIDKWKLADKYPEREDWRDDFLDGLSYPFPECGNRIGIDTWLPHINSGDLDEVNYFIRAVKSIYKNPVYYIKPHSQSWYSSNLLDNKIAKVNQFILENYYDKAFIEEINNTAISYYEELIGKKMNREPFDSETISFFQKNYYDIVNYFKPLVLRDSLFDIDFEGIKDLKYKYGEIDIQIQYAFIDFFNNEFEKLRETRSNIIDIFERLLERYLFNKSVKIFPSGLKVYTKIKPREHDSGFFIYDEKNEIKLNALSSGEKKIIILFFMALLFEDYMLIIDEPELSLSLVWQETLLPDLLNETNIKQVFVATHSPFIAEDPILQDYVKPLALAEDDVGYD